MAGVLPSMKQHILPTGVQLIFSSRHRHQFFRLQFLRHGEFQVFQILLLKSSQNQINCLHSMVELLQTVSRNAPPRFPIFQTPKVLCCKERAFLLAQRMS